MPDIGFGIMVVARERERNVKIGRRRRFLQDL